MDLFCKLQRHSSKSLPTLYRQLLITATTTLPNKLVTSTNGKPTVVLLTSTITNCQQQSTVTHSACGSIVCLVEINKTKTICKPPALLFLYFVMCQQTGIFRQKNLDIIKMPTFCSKVTQSTNLTPLSFHTFSLFSVVLMSLMAFME